jgi:hypothetical protein
MEHFEVADMFGRRAQPRLALDLRWEVHVLGSIGDNDGRGRAEVRIHVSVTNAGRGPAAGLCVTLSEPTRPWALVNADPDTLYVLLPAPRGFLWRVAMPSGALLFQGDTLPLLSHRFRMSGENPASAFEIHARADCLGAPGVTGTLSLTAEELQAAALLVFRRSGLRGFGWL